VAVVSEIHFVEESETGNSATYANHKGDPNEKNILCIGCHGLNAY